ncbi:MAG: class I SAM-dependent methyltransferase [Magnetococcales bacterium]|nr:class I SAM-dependent methyltransferase [Magnetococcales bacterium]
MSQDSTRDYFDGQADSYQQASDAWPWSWLRLREARAVAALLGRVQGHRLLDLGCGAGYYTRYFLARGAVHVVAVDRSAPMTAHLPAQRVTPITADAGEVRFDQPFSRMVSAGLMEFVPDPERVLRNARNAAEQGGIMALLTPEAGLLGSLYRRFHLGHGVEIRLFAYDELTAMAQRCGWRVVDHRRVFPFTLALRLEAGS